MTDFSIELVHKVAKLAKIRINNEEASQFAKDLTSIINEIEKLQEVDTRSILPLHNISEREVLLRKDVVSEGNIVDKILSNTKNSEFNCFIVPKVIE